MKARPAWRGIGGTLAAFVLAWLAWTYAPYAIARLGLGVFVLLGRVGAVILALSVAERVFARLEGSGH